MTGKIDWYKVCILSWAKKNQHICWEDHVKAGALAMARETAKLIGRKEVLAIAKKAIVKAKSEAPEVEEKTQAETERFMPNVEARRVPSFMLRRTR